MASNILDTIDRLKNELDTMRPLSSDVIARVEQKLRIEWNYHSNAVEGNSLTLGETRSLILHGLTARGKPLRDHLDIEGHDQAVKAIERAVQEDQGLSEVFIRNLHAVLLKEPYEVAAMTPDGQPTRRLVTIGDYKTMPNNVRTSTGEMYYFTPPEQVKPAMSDLIDWYRAQAAAGEHPVIIAAIFHYRFVRIHPFDDGNGRMARLLMNLILIRHGYTVAIVRIADRDRYIRELEQIDRTENPAQFIDYVASCCEYALNLYLKAVRGETVEDAEDIDHEIALFKRSLVPAVESDEQVSLRQFAKTVVLPFHDYCQSKITSLVSGVFTDWDHFTSRATARSVDGTMFHVSMKSEKLEELPECAAELSIVFSAELTGFRNTNRNFMVQLETVRNSRECIWNIELITWGDTSRSDGFSNRYVGQDQKELNTRFNLLLRHMMHVMDEWSSGVGEVTEEAARKNAP